MAMLLIALLLGVGMVSLAGWSQSRRLDEGARRFETLLLMARADAANLGKKLRVAFQETQDGQVEIQILWEADPLGAPQLFTEYSACTWLHYLPAALVEVRRCELSASSDYRLMESEQMREEGASDLALDAITFYPDGSCDSAVIELASTSEHDDRAALIEIHGLTGSITSRILTPSELADQMQE